MYRFIVPLLVLVSVVGCRHASQMELLHDAEAFLPSMPDSADIRLQGVDADLLCGEEEAYYALLRTMTDGIQGKASLNDTLVKRAYTFYKHKSSDGTLDGRFVLRHSGQAALCMGDWYAEKDSDVMSEECYREAISLAEKSEDWRTCYISYSRLASQVQCKDVHDAVKLTEKAIEAYGKSNDNVNNLVSLYGYAAIYCSHMAYMPGKDSCSRIALDYAYKAYELAKDSCSEETCNEALVTLADIYWSMGDYSKALDHVRGIKIRNLSSENSQRMNMKRANYYLRCDSFAKAKQLYQAPEHIDSKLLKYLYARGLATVAIKQDMPGDTILQCINTAFANAEENYLDELRTKYDYHQKVLNIEKRNARLVYENKLRFWIFAGVVCVVVIVSLLLCWMFFLRERMRREQLRGSLMRRKHELEMSIEERHWAESERLLLQEQQKVKIQEAIFLQKEMALLREKQQVLEESNRRKSAIVKHLQKYIIGRMDITAKLKGGTSRLKMSSREWTEVEQTLDEIDDRCISKMRSSFKWLSVDDIRLCIMVRLGMSNPIIAHVYGITPSAVQYRKRTLARKCFGDRDPRITLYDAICSL